MTLRFVAAGVIAVVIAIIGLIVDARQVAATFVVAYVAAVSVVLGVLAMVMIAHLTTATWFGAFRHRADVVVATLPALAGLGILLLLCLPALYRWTNLPSGVGWYLNAPFFIVRFVVHWIVWIGIAELLRATARIEARGDIARAARRYRVISASGLVVLGFTMTFASFDWMMSLTPDWSSTIYGVYWFAGGMVGALALLALRVPRDGDPSPDDLQSLGKLLVTFILFWLYIGFSQYIVIWSANLPHEVSWYVARTKGPWGVVALVLLAGMFALPFLGLIVRGVKRSRFALGAFGLLLLFLHYIDTYWIVMPGLAAVSWWTIVLSAATVVIVIEPTLVLAATRPSAFGQGGRAV